MTSLVPRFFQNLNMCMQGEPGIFSHVTIDIIEIGPASLEQKGNVFVLFNQLCSTLSVYDDIRLPTSRYV